MISSLSGRVTHIADSFLVLEISGVGFKVAVPRQVLSDVHSGQVLTLHTYLVVRETELSLYGFPSMEARDTFTLLLGVERVGPKLALAILSSLSVASLRAAVMNGQSAVLSKISGVGSKTAQKIVLDLASKVLPMDGDTEIAAVQVGDTDLLEALTSLGYSVVEAQTAVQSLPKDAPADIEERLKLALKYFN
jgi:Holliday junction DNA helicase RuvA